MKKPTVVSCFLLAVSLIASTLKATHNRSGEILYYKLPGAYTYSIVVIKYTNDGSGIADRCADTVSFGDGTKGVLQRINGVAGSCCGTIPCGEMIVNQTNYKVKKNIYSIIHTYPGPGTYVLSSLDPNRSGGSINIPNSINVPFYIESSLVIKSNDPQNSSPQLARPPIDQGVAGDCFYHNPCAFDPDGDSLSFKLVACKGVVGYSFPTAGSGGFFSIDGETGLLSWCKPQAQGMYNVAIRIEEWRKQPDCSSYELIGYVTRDMEIMVSTGSVTIITTSPLPDTCMKAGSVLNRTFTASTGAAATFTMEVLGSVSSPFTSAAPAMITPSVVNSGATAVFNWTTTCVHAQRLAHYVHVVITANTAPFPRTEYRTFKVKLVSPSPKIVSAVTNTNQITLTWNSLKSCAAVSQYKIYRNLTNSTWSPVSCSTGVPGNSGYVNIGNVSSGVPVDTVFTDTDLWWLPVNATGKYILTAVMKDCSESMADTMITEKLLVGLQDNSNPDKDLGVFPNPTQTECTVLFHSAQKGPVLINLFSVDGKKVLEKSAATDKPLVIETVNLPSGVYLLKIYLDDKTYQRKLIKN